MGLFTRQEARPIDWSCPRHTQYTVDPTKEDGLPPNHEPPELARRKSERVQQERQREKEAKRTGRAKWDKMQDEADDVIEAETGARPTRKRIRKYRRCAIFSAVAVGLMWLSWTSWIAYYIATQAWPLLPLTDKTVNNRRFFGQLNAIIGTFIVFFGLALVAPICLALVDHSKEAKTAAKRFTLRASALFLVIFTFLIGLAPSAVLTTVVRHRAYQRTCAKFPATVFFSGGTPLLKASWNDQVLHNTVYAQILHTSNHTPIATWLLTRPVHDLLVFTRTERPIDNSDGRKTIKLSNDDEMGRINATTRYQIRYNLTTLMAEGFGGYHARFSNDETWLQDISIFAPRENDEPGWSTELRPQGSVNTHPPTFMIRKSDGAGPVSLESVGVDPNSCRRLKVCASGWDLENDTHNAIQALVPMGLTLYHHAYWSRRCSG